MNGNEAEGVDTEREAGQKHAGEVIRRLKIAHPEAGIVLDYGSAWELLVAVILSAQSTDKQVNRVTATLFRKYHTPRDYAEADRAELEQDIHSTGFFRNKAKHIQGAARGVLENFGGSVPRTIAELITLPGVARKTANIVLSRAYPEAYRADPNAGIAVDTHVHRLSRRLGLSDAKTPDKTEPQLMKVVPREEWSGFSYLLIDHGRAVCTARSPRCADCALQDICPSAFSGSF